MPDAKVAYQWKEVMPSGYGTLLVTPWSDPQKHAWPMDFVWETPEAAVLALTEMGIDPEESDPWVLVKVTVEPIGRPTVPPQII